MKNKKRNIVVVVIITIILLITAGIIGWMIAQKTQIPGKQTNTARPAPTIQEQANIVSSNQPVGTSLTVNNPTFTIDGKTATGFGIEVSFEDGILGSNDKTVTFSPKSRIVPPKGQSQVGVPDDIYEFTAMEHRTADDIIKEANESPLNTKKAEQKKINGFTVVESADGGFCENRYAEVIGKAYNYQFSSLGCAHDEKADFSSFEKAISTMKFTDK